MRLNQSILERFSGTGENWWRMTDRVAESIGRDQIARAEVKKLLYGGVLIPAGQIWRGAGRTGRVLYNCFVMGIDPNDPADRIAARVTDWTRRGCGVGINVSEWCRCSGNAAALKEIVRTIALSQESLWRAGEKRTATMVNIDFGTPGLVSVCRSLDVDPIYRHLNIGVNVRDSDMLALCRSHSVSAGSSDNSTVRGIAELAWRSGNPGLIFSERVNRDHPFSEPLSACNPCAEQHLRPHEGCNLASVNLAALVANQRFEWQQYREVIRAGIRFLDSVVDTSEFPSDQSRHLARQRRRIGLGVTGLASALLAMGIDYESQDAVQFAVDLARELRAVALAESETLAARYGAFPEPAKKHFAVPRRNSYLLSIAPAGAISVLWGVSSGIEPFFARTVYKGPLRAHALRTSDAQRLKASCNISPYQHVTMTAAWQQHVDGGISKTVNLTASATIDDVLRVFQNAWRSGCKGISVFRRGSRACALSGKPGQYRIRERDVQV